MIDFSDPNEWPRHVLVDRMRRALKLLDHPAADAHALEWQTERLTLLREVQEEIPEKHRD